VAPGGTLPRKGRVLRHSLPWDRHLLTIISHHKEEGGGGGARWHPAKERESSKALSPLGQAPSHHHQSSQGGGGRRWRQVAPCSRKGRVLRHSLPWRQAPSHHHQTSPGIKQAQKLVRPTAHGLVRTSCSSSLV